MKNILLLIVLVILGSTAAFGQSLYSKDEKEIVDLLVKMYDPSVWNNKDAYHTAMGQYMDPHFIYISREGADQDLDAILEDFDKKFATNRYEPFAFKYLTVHSYGDTAIATYILAFKGKRDSKPFSGRVRVTKVFARRGGKWLNILEHESNISAELDTPAPVLRPAWSGPPE